MFINYNNKEHKQRTKVESQVEKWKNIRAWHTGGVLAVTDWVTVLPYLNWLKRKTCSSLTLEYMDGQRAQIEKDIHRGAFFMTNHRDIVLDSAWLSMLLRMHYNIRPYIGIGNNLFGKWWIEPFVRFNRSFVVIRNGNAREVLENAKTLSAYIRHLRQRGKSIWLAQREGRAKDGNDHTQGAVLKMLTLGSENFLDAIYQLNICPVSLNYEYDPCDYLKAQEMQLKRDNPAWKKSKQDDLLSMQTGIEGQKGKVVFRMTSSINHWIDAHRSELEAMSRNEQINAIAAEIDRHIFAGYERYARGEQFDRYIESRLQLIKIDGKDEEFLKERLYEMYDNPMKNQARLGINH